MMQQDSPVTGEGGESVMDSLLLLMSSIGLSIFGYSCRLGYCVVHVFLLTLLLLYKVEQVHMFATKTVGFCVCVSPLGYVNMIWFSC